jgi:Protein of unknown function (DUF3040)
MLSDRERQLLTDIEQQLRIEDPSLADKFEGASRQARAGHQRLIATALGVLVLLAAFAILFGSPGMAVAFALIGGTIALLWCVLSFEMGSNEASFGIDSSRYPNSSRWTARIHGLCRQRRTVSSLCAIPGELCYRFAQRGPDFEVSRDGVEVGTAPGSFARDSTKAISWSPNSLFSMRVVRRSDVTRKPALLANPIARPFSVLTQ